MQSAKMNKGETEERKKRVEKVDSPIILGMKEEIFVNK
jgi:hypothetical protein